LSWIGGVLLVPIQVTPVMDEYWIPKIQDFLVIEEQIREKINDDSSIETIYENALSIFI